MEKASKDELYQLYHQKLYTGGGEGSKVRKTTGNFFSLWYFSIGYVYEDQIAGTTNARFLKSSKLKKDYFEQIILEPGDFVEVNAATSALMTTEDSPCQIIDTSKSNNNSGTLHKEREVKKRTHLLQEEKELSDRSSVVPIHPFFTKGKKTLPTKVVAEKDHQLDEVMDLEDKGSDEDEMLGEDLKRKSDSTFTDGKRAKKEHDELWINSLIYKNINTLRKIVKNNKTILQCIPCNRSENHTEKISLGCWPGG